MRYPDRYELYIRQDIFSIFADFFIPVFGH